MPKLFDMNSSLTFVCIYFRDGRKVYRSSRLKEDKICREMGMKGLQQRFINGRYKGEYNTAIIFDNKTKSVLERFDEYGKKIYNHAKDQ